MANHTRITALSGQYHTSDIIDALASDAQVAAYEWRENNRKTPADLGDLAIRRANEWEEKTTLLIACAQALRDVERKYD